MNATVVNAEQEILTDFGRGLSRLDRTLQRIGRSLNSTELRLTQDLGLANETDAKYQDIENRTMMIQGRVETNNRTVLSINSTEDALNHTMHTVGIHFLALNATVTE